MHSLIMYMYFSYSRQGGSVQANSEFRYTLVQRPLLSLYYVERQERLIMNKNRRKPEVELEAPRALYTCQ